MKIGYARVSGEGQNLAQQVAALKEAGCEQVFSEIITSNRVVCPALEQALVLVKPGDSLVVWRMDRLGERTLDLIRFIQDLQQRGVYFQSLCEGLNSGTPLGKMLYSFISALADNERDLAIERTLKGLEVVKSRVKPGGKAKGGRPRSLSKCEIEAAMVLLSKPGPMGTVPSLTSVAEALNTSKATLSRRLKEIKQEGNSPKPPKQDDQK